MKGGANDGYRNWGNGMVRGRRRGDCFSARKEGESDVEESGVKNVGAEWLEVVWQREWW